MVLSVEETLVYFGYTYAPNLTHQGATVITEILSTNGYRNPAPPKTPTSSFMAQKMHFQRENYTIGYKINMHLEYKGSTCTFTS
jgi:hypothetical protein